MKSFKEYITEAKKADYKTVRKWVFDKLENSDMDSEEMEKAFVKEYGKAALSHYEKALSEYMD